MAAGGTRTYAPRMAPEDRRRQLLDAALALIAEEGYGSVTIEAVANRVGVTRPVVYSVFSNIDELLVTLLDAHEKRTLASVGKAVHDDGSGPGALVRNAMVEFLKSIKASPDGWKVILQAEDSAAPEEVRRRNVRGRDHVTALLADALGTSLGPAARELDMEIVAEGIITLAHRGGTLMLTDPDRYPLERMLGMAELLAAQVDALSAAGAR
jgi:AcrR family transcriptional regulator